MCSLKWEKAKEKKKSFRAFLTRKKEEGKNKQKERKNTASLSQEMEGFQKYFGAFLSGEKKERKGKTSQRNFSNGQLWHP